MTSLAPPVVLALAVLGGYLLGTIPFGLIATQMAGLGDVRKIGSGNIGATNVLRTGRRDLALIALLGDGGKGAVAALLAGALWGADAAHISAGAAFLGHLFPVWLGFKGGKGVATFFGVLFALQWPVGLAAGATWLLTAGIFRFSSLASLAAAALAPIWFFLLAPGHPLGPVLAAIMGVVIFIRHHANIRRLLKGEEPRIGAKSKT